MSSPIRRTICGASPSEGSSINNTVGAVISARPMASICCSPPDNATPGWLPRSARMGNSRWTKLRSPPRMASVRFSRTLNVGKMRRPCGTRVMPRRATRWAERPWTATPSTRTEPRRGVMAPAIAIRVEVLPAPLRPSSATASPCPTRREAFRTTVLPPYATHRSSTISRSAVLVGSTKVDLLYAMVGANLGRRPVGNDDAVVQHRDALRDCEDHVEVMLDEHQGHLIGQRAQPRDGGLPLLAREARHRLVQ